MTDEAAREHTRWLSLNQATTKHLTIPEAIEVAANHGLGGIGFWRDRLAETGPERAARLAADAGLAVTSVCRGGFFPAADDESRRAALEDNRAAVRETAAAGADVLVLVCGGLPPGSRDLVAARAMVADGVEALAPYAAEHGVRLAIEPMHPIFAADRSVITTLGQALDLAESVPTHFVGIVVDSYHLWWDPALEAQLARARGRILSYQISDWVVPLPDDPQTGNLLGRAHVGDGHIDFARLTEWVAAAGYRGLVEVEIFNAGIWSAPPDDTLSTLVERFHAHLPAPLPWAL